MSIHAMEESERKTSRQPHQSVSEKKVLRRVLKVVREVEQCVLMKASKVMFCTIKQKE